jgi:hypothetical protein
MQSYAESVETCGLKMVTIFKALINNTYNYTYIVIMRLEVILEIKNWYFNIPLQQSMGNFYREFHQYR